MKKVDGACACRTVAAHAAEILIEQLAHGGRLVNAATIGDKQKMFVSALQQAGARVLDFMLPPRCAGCGDVVADPRSFCADCWGEIDWLATGCCRQCAIPIEGSVHDVCAGCEASPPAIVRTRAVARYDDATRGLAMRLKHGRKVGLAKFMGHAMALRLADIDEDAVLVPVPLHRARLWKRGFNQAALLAKEIGERVDRPVQPDAIRRTRSTEPMVRMTPAQREKNVRGAFAVNHPERIAGRSVLLVDDVRTSGATLEACAKVLLAAGARQVEAILWARVVRGRDLTR